jgi:hypothetical protein
MNDQTDKHEGTNEAVARYVVTLDLTDADANFAVTEALREFASRQRWEAKEDPDGNAAGRVRWAEAAEAALERAENAQRVEAGGKPIAAQALEAVLEALAIPHPATVGDGEVHDKILADRTRHAVVFLQSFLDADRGELHPEWSLGYFREKLSENPPTGYRTWDEAVAERHAREQAEAGPGRGAEPTARLADSPAFRQLLEAQGIASEPEAGE